MLLSSISSVEVVDQSHMSWKLDALRNLTPKAPETLDDIDKDFHDCGVTCAIAAAVVAFLALISKARD